MSAFANLPQLSLTEWSILELTNDPDMSVSRLARRSHDPQLLTTKDAYIWAVILADAAVRDTISEEGVRRLVASRELRPELLLRAIGDPSENVAVTFQALTNRVNEAYRSLVERGLIEDPPIVFIGGIAISVLGWIPFSFTKKTVEGKVVSRKINAMFWKYERSSRKGVTTTVLEFRLMRLLNALKTGISAAQRELTTGESPEN
jgi:hypothetical protein